MNTAEAIARFNDSWDRATGPRSKFSETLTPEGRHIRRLLEDAPPAVVRVLLGGIGAAGDETMPATKPGNMRQVQPGKAVSRSKRPAIVLSLALLALCASSPWLAQKTGTCVVCLASAALAGAAVVSAMRRPGRGNDSACASPQPRTGARPEFSVDPSALDKAVAIFSTALGDVIASAKEKEEDSALGFDITASKAFGDWVQKFVDETRRDGADDGFAMLKDELVSKLRTMGISVFDRIRRGKDGKAALPPRDAFRDSRPEGHDEFTRVIHAAVYSRRGILAMGELA